MSKVRLLELGRGVEERGAQTSPDAMEYFVFLPADFHFFIADTRHNVWPVFVVPLQLQSIRCMLQQSPLGIAFAWRQQSLIT